MRAALLTLIATAVLPGQTAEDLTFYSRLNDGRTAGQSLSRFLRDQAGRHLDERATRVRQTTDWAAYRTRFREQLMATLGGPFPEKTPLNTSVVGVVEKQGYRIEKVVFESQPKFFVTANLYLPATGSGPFPGILFPLGHESGAKAHSAWQMVLGNLARRGFVLLAWDPIGQGERVQLYDEDFKGSKLVQSTTEHTMQGIQTLLVGDALARYTIWDGIRALDYLLSRPEVDRTRIGITGNSGGGTHTSYIGALEDRIHAAAPSCYITSWRRLLDTIGPQDAEQCFPGWLAARYDHADFIYAFAPRPFLMLTAIRDFFSIGGARETYAEAVRTLDSLGAAEKFAKVEADDGHGYTQPRREAAYRWFTRWLKGAEDRSPESELALASETELNCTPTGQVATSLRGTTVHELNLARWKQQRKPGTLEDARRLAAFTLRTAAPPVQSYGVIPLPGGARMEKLVYQTEPGIPVPAVLYQPAGEGRRPASILVHGRGKAFTRDLALARLAQGEAVLAIDVRGMGETEGAAAKGGDWPRYFGDYDAAMTAILLARPLAGMRAEDISAGVSLLAAHSGIDATRIALYGWDAGAIPALYAAAFDSRIAAVTLNGLLTSYESVIRQRIHRRVFEHIVVGALRSYDLPDLIRWIAPRKVTVERRVDPLGLDL